MIDVMWDVSIEKKRREFVKRRNACALELSKRKLLDTPSADAIRGLIAMYESFLVVLEKARPITQAGDEVND